MPARFPVHGPVEIYINSGHTTPFLFLGTARVTPVITWMPVYEPVINTYGGSVPMDRIYNGEEAIVSVLLNRYDETVLALAQARPTHSAGAKGFNLFGEVGALSISDGLSMGLVTTFPFSGTANNTAQGMAPGIHWFSAELIGPDDLSPGIKAGEIQLIFQCQRVFVGRDGTVQGGTTVPAGFVSPGGFALYSNVLPTLPTPIAT